MEKVQLFIEQASSGKAPDAWDISKHIGLQRLYYIKSGSGRIIMKDRADIPFTAGKIYVFSNTMWQEFVSDPIDPIDHIYFDFFSTPPIVSDEPIIYDVPTDSALSCILKFVDKVLPIRIDGCWYPYRQARNFGKFDSTLHGSDEERFDILYKALELLLLTLSNERELPFSNDDMISRILEHIHQNYAVGVTVNELAKMANFQVSHFIRRFKQVMGITPYAYIYRYRCSVANMLISSGMSVTETAEKLGYSTASTLSRALHLSKKKENGQYFE